MVGWAAVNLTSTHNIEWRAAVKLPCIPKVGEWRAGQSGIAAETKVGCRE
jgi:hypothetical protein